MVYPANLGFITYTTPITEQTVLEEDGIKTIITVGLRTCGSFGVLRPKDIIKEMISPNRLWVIENINQKTESNNRPISLIMSAKEAETGHPLRALKVPKLKIPNKIYYEDYKEIYRDAQNQLNQITQKA